MPRYLAPFAIAEKTTGVGTPPDDSAQRNPWLLRIFLRSAAYYAVAWWGHGCDGRVAILCSIGASAHGVRPRRGLHSCAHSSSRPLSSGRSAVAADRMLPRIVVGIRRSDCARHGSAGDRQFRCPGNIPDIARRAHLASGGDSRNLPAVCRGRGHLRRARSRHFRQDAAAIFVRQRQYACALCDLRPAFPFRLA